MRNDGWFIVLIIFLADRPASVHLILLNSDYSDNIDV